MRRCGSVPHTLRYPGFCLAGGQTICPATSWRCCCLLLLPLASFVLGTHPYLSPVCSSAQPLAPPFQEPQPIFLPPKFLYQLLGPSIFLLVAAPSAVLQPASRPLALCWTPEQLERVVKASFSQSNHQHRSNNISTSSQHQLRLWKRSPVTSRLHHSYHILSLSPLHTPPTLTLTSHLGTWLGGVQLFLSPALFQRSCLYFLETTRPWKTLF